MRNGHVAPLPTDVEAIVELVRRAAREECVPGACLVAPLLDRCVRDAVDDLRDSRIKAFVPLLARRRVRDCIHAGICDTEEI